MAVATALLSHDAGLRIDEIAGLRMPNLDLLHGTVTIADIIIRPNTTAATTNSAPNMRAGIIVTSRT